MSKSRISRTVAAVFFPLILGFAAMAQSPVIPHLRTTTVREVAWSKTRVLMVRGGTVRMVDRSRRTLWTYSTEPNEILDVAVGPRGLIYVTSADGVVDILNPRGRRIWGHFMSGSANYSQIAPFRGGFLVVLDMESYRREKSQVTDDVIEYWKRGKRIWRKSFPAHAKLAVRANQISAEIDGRGGHNSTIISPGCTRMDPICASLE